MLLAIGIMLALAGLAWWWTRIMDRAYEQGKSLGDLQGCTQFLGRLIGCNLEGEEGLEAFLQMYQEKVASSELPESPELGREVFKPDPQDTDSTYDERCERWRAGGIAMWYVVGTMHQGSWQEELKQRPYDLYERHGKPIDGLRAKKGERDRASR